MRRRLLLKDKLPSTYTRLEYIYNPSSAYIDTGVRRDAYTRCSMDIVLMRQSAGFLPIFGCRSGWTNASMKALYISDSKFFINYGTFDGSSNIPYTMGTKCHIELNNNIYTFNGEEYKCTTKISTPITYNCGIGKVIGDGPNSATLKIYSFKMWDGTEFIRNFIPARSKADNTVGLYDLVGSKFYSSASGAAFQGSDETLSTSEE